MLVVGHDPGALMEIGCDRRIAPTMPIHADFSIAIKIIEQHVFARQLVMIGRDVLAEHYQIGITISRRPTPGVLKRAKDLIVSAVLFDDVKHVLDWTGFAHLVGNNAVAASRRAQ